MVDHLFTADSALTHQHVHSPGLEHNLLGDSAHRYAIVYLPPSYFTSPDRRYPAIYLLHGYNGTSSSWTHGAYQGFSIQPAMDALINEGRIQEMIVVMPDTRNGYCGSYYVNSPVSGNWEDFIARDLVAYIDRTYRTLPHAASRGLAGQSMGGYGALYVGMQNTDVFGVVFATSACCLEWIGDLTEDVEAWTMTLDVGSRADLGRLPQTGRHWKGNYPNALIGFAAAASPNPDNPPLFVDLPYTVVGGKLVPSEPAYQRWTAHFPVHMIDRCRAGLQTMRGFRFAVGAHDHLSHIPLGNRAFSKALTERAIPHVFNEYDTDHASSVREWIETQILPFFSETLAFAAPAAV